MLYTSTQKHQNGLEHVSGIERLSFVVDLIREVPLFSITTLTPPLLQIMIFIETELESSSEFDDEQRYSRSMQLEPRSKQTSKKHVGKTTSSAGD